MSEAAAAPVAAAPAFDREEFKAVRDAAVDAASVSTGLWLSYLFVLFYLLVVVGSVSHRELFFKSPMRLPFLTVDLPLEGFCWLGPLLFLVTHAYVLLHFVLLGEKARALDAWLDERVPDRASRAALRAQLPISAFVQFLAGPLKMRRGSTGGLLLGIAWISLAFGPVLLLIFFELRFLPYHDEWITWWHRCAVALDLALLWTLWPEAIRDRMAGPAWRSLGWVATSVMAGMSLLALLLVFAVATFPGEWWEDVLPYVPLREALVAGPLDKKTLRPSSLWSNRLVLTGFDAIDRAKYDTTAKLAAVPFTVSLRSRRFEGAVLIDATLSRVDFSGARLDGALLNRARLLGTYFDHAVVAGAQFQDAQLQGASFYQARAQGASFDNAQLQGISMADAQLQAASFAGANLQAASLATADLRGAALNRADLRGANLSKAWLQGAVFDGAQLDGAAFKQTHVAGAVFGSARAGALGIWAVDIDTGMGQPKCEGLEDESCDPADTPHRLKQIVERFVWDVPVRLETLRRLELAGAAPAVAGGDAASRLAVLQMHATRHAEDTDLADLWHEIACGVDGAPFALASFVGTLNDPFAFRFTSGSTQTILLASRFLSEQCAAMPEIVPAVRMRLIEIINSKAAKQVQSQN